MAGAGRAAQARLQGAERGTSALNNHLAHLLMDQGKLSEAEPLFRISLEACRRVLGGDPTR